MRLRVINLCLLSMLLLGSCARNKEEMKPDDTLTREEITLIQQEISTQMDNVLEGIETNDPDKLFRDFWRSDSASFYLNGNQMKGYDQIINGFRQGMESRKNSGIEVTGEEIVVLGPRAAMHLAEFTNEMVLTNDSTLTVAGYWSAVFKKLDGQWKVVHVHESFNPVMAETQE